MKKSMGKKALVALGMGGCFIAGAMASGGNEWVTALLNREIKITYNGEVQTFKDATGATVYPLSYNGTTYLPVRAVSGLVNLSVEWDGANNTVILGSTEAAPTALTARENSGGTEFSYVITDADMLKFSGSDAVQEYKSGVYWHQWNSTASASQARVCYFDVAGKSELTFTAATDAESTIRVVDQDYNTITSFTLTPGQIASKTIALNGVSKIGFCSDAPSGKYEHKGDKVNGNVYIYEPMVK